MNHFYQWIAGSLVALGLYLLLSYFFPGVYGPARKVMRLLAPKRLTQSQVMQNQIAEKIAPQLSLDPIKRAQMEMTLKNLGHTESPELFQARALAQSLYFMAMASVSLLISVPLGVGIMAFCGISFYNRQSTSLERELVKKRNQIEKELPQFASTICQSLGSTRDIVAILSAYRRVCGPTLAQEIDKTLNDVVTGNAERAIHAFEMRIASPKLSQLTRGLLAVLRGEDQRQYFDILAAEFRKSQDEAIERELLERPHKLYPYMGVLFVFLILMIVASLGTDIYHSLGSITG